MLRQTFSNMVQDDRQHFGYTYKGDIKIILVAKCSQCHFFNFYIFITINFLSVVVSDKCPIHFANFYLHHVFQEPTSYQVKILTLKTLVESSFCCYFVIFVILVVFNIVTNRCTSSRLDLKDVWFPIFIIAHAVDLRSEHYLVVNFRVTIIIFHFFGNYALHHAVSLLTGVSQKVLHHMPQVHQNLVSRWHRPLIGDNSITIFINWMQEERSWLSRRDHPAVGLFGQVFVDIVHLRCPKATEYIVECSQRTRDAGSGGYIPALGLRSLLHQNSILRRLHIVGYLLELRVRRVIIVLLRQITNPLIPKHKLPIEKLIEPMLKLWHIRTEATVIGQVIEFELAEVDGDGTLLPVRSFRITEELVDEVLV